MKKISIFSTLLAGVVAFSACTPEIEPAQDPISYDPVDAATLVANVTTADFANPIDLGTYEADLISAFTVDLTATPELGAGDKVSYKMHTSDTEDMAKVKDLAVTVEGNTLKVSKEELNEIMKGFFGKRPAQNILYVKVRTIVTASTGANIEFISEVYPTTITSAAARTIEESYNLTVVGKDAKKMQHSTTDVYEDPVFFTTIEIEANAEWYITSESGVRFGSGEGEGTLAQDAANNVIMSEAGIYIVNANMETLTFTLEKKEKKAEPKPYWFVGSFNGWNNNATGAAAGLIPMSIVKDYQYDAATGAGAFTFIAYLEVGGEYKLIGKPGSWDDQVGMKDGELVFNDPSSGNIIVSETGYYVVNVNTTDFTTSIEPATTTPAEQPAMEFVGSFEGWGATPVIMEPMGLKHVWYARYTFAEDCEGKFRTDSSWATNWGSKDFPFGLGNPGGDNIMITAGTYDIIFNDATACYYFLPVAE